jgi:2-polyprenyl-3-methyl-5-hydroxy-6-metoxy-1,4-benzoquinol methylase
MASPRKLVTDRATQVDPSHAVAPPQTARPAGRTRVTPTVNHHQPPTLVDGSSDALELLRNENVRQGFAALDGLERLDQATARRLLKDRLETEARRAADTLPVLAKEPGATPQNYATMTSETNHTRIRRVLDFVDTDDRILEIGVGFGYITGMLMRETAMSSYTGIDITKRQIAAARRVAKVYNAASIPVHLEVLNLYDLTAEWVDKHAPDLVLLLEVLEHVPDAEGALATVARSVREDAAILFSVPTNGRIEHVWGHVSIFDGTRIRGYVRPSRAGRTTRRNRPGPMGFCPRHEIEFGAGTIDRADPPLARTGIRSSAGNSTLHRDTHDRGDAPTQPAGGQGHPRARPRWCRPPDGR